MNNTYNNTNLYNSSFADALKKSIEPNTNITTNKINKTDTNNIKFHKLDNKLPGTIKYIDI